MMITEMFFFTNLVSGFTEINPAENPNVRMYPTPEEMKNASPGKIRSAMQPGPLGNPLPQGPFPDHSFVPRTIQHLYRLVNC